MGVTGGRVGGRSLSLPPLGGGQESQDLGDVFSLLDGLDLDVRIGNEVSHCSAVMMCNKEEHYLFCAIVFFNAKLKGIRVITAWGTLATGPLQWVVSRLVPIKA